MVGRDAWLPKIAKNHVAATPYMLTDLAVVKSHCKTFKTLFPKVELFYAIKAFSDKEVIKAISDIVDGFDAASVEEINTLLAQGVAPERIAYSNPVKPVETINESVLRGITKYAAQSREELRKLASCSKGLDVYIRTKMDDSHSAVPLSAKFGCSNSWVVELIEYAKELGLNPVGITFHVGSQQTGLEQWEKAVKISQNLLKEAQKTVPGVHLINIGGGFPAQYSENDTDISEVAQVLNPVFNAEPNITYMAEPGRYIVADSSVIVSSVIGVEERDDKTWVYLDVGLFQAFSGALRYESFPYTPFLIDKKSSDKSKNYILTGPSCDSQDIILYDAQLPAGIKIGDRLGFPNVGAYTIVYGSDFNGFKVPPRFFIDTSKPKGGS